jgi:serine/threonine-protein kinase
MGEVFLAEDTRLHRQVALKRLTSDSLSNADTRARILHEARAIAKLHHPGIAAIFDVVEDADTVWIVMEYVRGETLAARLRRERPPLARAVDIGLQITEALAAAHAHGVLHCDLKPSNVLITPDDKAKLLDFGLARPTAEAAATAETRLASQSSSAHLGRLSGTAGYLAPERLSGAPVDERGDIYSLGVALFELLSGRRPFAGTDLVAVAASALTSAPPSPSSLDPAVPEALSAVVLKALSSNPGLRFQTATDVASALRSAARGGPPSSTTHDRSARRSRPLHLMLALAALIAVATGAAFAVRALWFAGTATAPQTAAAQAIVVKPFANLSGDAANDYLGVGMADDLTTRLSALGRVTMVSRAATAAYLVEHPQPRTLARDLGVSYIVDGGIQRTADRLHVTVTLVGADGSVRWGREYDGLLTNVFAIQHDIAAAVADQLNLALTASDRKRLADQPTANTEAFADYSQGRLFLDRRDAKGNIDHAIEAFTRAMEKDPRFALAQAGLGSAYWEKYNDTKDALWTTRAIDASLEALRLDPNRAETHVTLGGIYIGLGRSESAADELHRALVLQPNLDDAHRLLGDVLAAAGKVDDAVAEYHRAIAIRPGYWQNHNRLAVAFMKVGRFEESAQAFRRVTELQPDSAVGFNNLGVVAMMQGDLTLGLESFTRAVAIAPRPNTFSNIGTIHFWNGNFEEARRAYEHAITLKPGAEFHRNLADALAGLRDMAGANVEYRRALDLATAQLNVNPKDAASLSLAALVEAKLGQPVEARKRIAAALALSPKDADVRYRDAAIAALLGERERALAALQEAIAQGYSPVLAARDLDLQTLRGLPQFAALVQAKSR